MDDDDDDDDVPFKTMAEMRMVGSNVPPPDWLHVAEFGDSIVDRANLSALNYFLQIKFPRAFRVFAETTLSGSVTALHLAIVPEKAVWQFVSEQLEGAETTNGKVSDEIYEELMEQEIQSTWDGMLLPDRILIVQEADAPDEAVIRQRVHPLVSMLIYRALGSD